MNAIHNSKPHYSESIMAALLVLGWVHPEGFTTIANKTLGRDVSAAFCPRGRYLSLMVGGQVVLDMDCRDKGLIERDVAGAAQEFNDRVMRWATTGDATALGVRLA